MLAVSYISDAMLSRMFGMMMILFLRYRRLCAFGICRATILTKATAVSVELDGIPAYRAWRTEGEFSYAQFGLRMNLAKKRNKIQPMDFALVSSS